MVGHDQVAVGRRHAGRPASEGRGAGLGTVARRAWPGRELGRALRGDAAAGLELAEMRAGFGWSIKQYIFYGPIRARRRSSASRNVGRATSATPSSSRSSRVTCCCCRGSTSQRCSAGFWSWRVRTRGRSSPTRKMIGRLQDPGNTTTLAHYLDLLAGAGLVTGLQKYAGGVVLRRASSPKLQVSTPS